MKEAVLVVARAMPVNAIDGILDAFKTHQVVALTDAHGNEQAAAFLQSLVRDPRFAATVNDVVIECGNARSGTVRRASVSRTRGDADGAERLKKYCAEVAPK